MRSTAGRTPPDPPGTERRRVDLDGLGVSYLAAGEGPPAVLVHGGGLDSAALSWRETVPALAPDNAVYAPDLPGYGESDSPEAAPTIRYYVGVLERFLDALGIERCALCGISLGGGVALGFALDRPERISRLVLVDSYGLGGQVPGGALSALFVRLPYVAEATWRLLGRSRRFVALSLRGGVAPENLTPELVDEVYALAARSDGRAWREFQLAEVGIGGLATNYVDRLPDLAAPTLLIHGEKDRLVPVSWAVRAGTLIDDAEVRVLPNCGHWPPRERPDRVAELLRSFLSGERSDA